MLCVTQRFSPEKAHCFDLDACHDCDNLGHISVALRFSQREVLCDDPNGSCWGNYFSNSNAVVGYCHALASDTSFCSFFYCCCCCLRRATLILTRVAVWRPNNALWRLVLYIISLFYPGSKLWVLWSSVRWRCSKQRNLYVMLRHL